MVEVQVHLAKWIPDLRRNEPINFGLCVLTGSGEFHYRFLPELPRDADQNEYRGLVRKWAETLDKYGPKALSWVGKKRGRYYFEAAHGEMVQVVDFERMYKELVL